MLEKISDGECVDIQGLKCWVPKVGYVFDPRSDKWIKQGVYKRHKNAAECYWERDPRWSKINEWKKEEDLQRKQNPKYYHFELQSFIEECWINRLCGFWYSNNGEPTYITGYHWYYLSCYQLDIGYPEYRDTDRQFWYAWQYSDEDPYSMGINLVMKRRGGKTYLAGCIALEKGTRLSKSNIGIQSKTDDDAKEVFNKAIIEPFRTLPFFFMPVSDIPSGRTPATKLNFRSGKVGTDPSKELGTSIDYKPSLVKGYDGYKLAFYIDDECGKTERINVLHRWNVVKNCLLDNKRKIIGKSIHTTTVDEMEAGGQNYLDIWKTSDQNNRNELGKTGSGLYKFFVPAHWMGDADKYGFPFKDANLKEILMERASTNDNRTLSSLIRQFPLTEKEAFSIDGSTCVYDSIKLNAQLDTIKYVDGRTFSLYRQGNFQWKDGVRDTEVEFVEHPSGRFMVSLTPPSEYQNQQKIRSGIRCPDNTTMFCAGADPYDHVQLTVNSVKTMSMGGFCIIKRWHPVVNDDSGHYKMKFDNGPAVLYVFRPSDPEIYWEDCLMCCIYYGCQVLAEDNKPGFIKHVTDRGYFGYLAWLPGRDKPGISNTSQTSGGGVNGHISEITDYFISHHVETVVFPILIEQWLEFSPKETTKYDAAMAFGFAYILFKTLGDTRAKHEKKNLRKSSSEANLFSLSVRRLQRSGKLHGW